MLNTWIECLVDVLPSGLFAVCSVGIIGTETKIELSKDIKYNVRLDMQILYSISKKIIVQKDVLENLSYKVNSSTYQIGNPITTPIY